MRATIEVEAQGRSPAGDDLFHRLKYHRPNPSFILLDKGPEMEAQYLGDAIADVGRWIEHIANIRG